MIFCSGLALRAWAIPHLHHVYFDEFVHLNIAENIYYHNEFCITMKGGFDQIEAYDLSAWPPGYHCALAFFYSLFGETSKTAFYLSVTLGSCSIMLFFLLAYLIFKKDIPALLCTFLFSIIPVFLKYSASAAICATSLFFNLLALLAFLFYANLKNLKTIFLLLVALIVSVYIRPENFIIMLLVLNYLAHGKKASSYFICVIFLVLFLLPFFLQIVTIFLYMPPCGWNEGLLTHLSNFKNNFSDNLMFWFSLFHPVSYSILAMFGYVSFKKIQPKISSFLTTWFVIFFLFYSTYHVGNFINCPDSDRYTANLYIPLTIFAGWGLHKLVNLFKRKKNLIFLFAVLFCSIDILSPLKFSLKRTFMRDVYAEYNFILKCRDSVPNNLYVVTYNPAIIISVMRKKAVSMNTFFQINPLPEKIVLFKDYWWSQNITDFYKFEIELKKYYAYKKILCTETFDSEIFTFILMEKHKT